MADTKKKVLVGLSGGVDSSVAIVLLRELGYDVSAAVLNLSPAHESTVAAARRVAKDLDVPFFEINGRETFKNSVVDYFCNEYLNGRTPNPCIFCNPTVKFKSLCDFADDNGFDYIATGHYARIEHGERTLLYRGSETARDQSYMLYRLTQHQLSKLLLPLSDVPKERVREIAKEHNISSWNAPDSQEICFIPDGDYSAYIEKHYGKSKTGYFISPEGKKVAQHSGISHYTIGQRKGLGIALGRPVFINEINATTGDINLAYSGGEFFNEITVGSLCFIPFDNIKYECRYKVKTRSVSPPQDATIYPKDDNTVSIVFDKAVRAPAPGQSAVIYDDDLVIGGGIIL